ncbi:hypothetical protein [Nitrosospira sp. Is2]|uniref:hypothetical protein n=1 Tax=Nitrosospira sp. Is2 TaxID=3080532 RepID=UPI002954BC63|nr:hypothetical protein [Nitrosospira sp. Is2]WON73731.1 hypothetical protein R5L00_14810 [Nitrosospira sp. Is2]
MISGLGAFAGGLSDGMRVGQDMKLRQQYVDEQKKSNERDAEVHQARMDALNLYRLKRNRLRAANDEITAGWGLPAPQPVPSVAPGLRDISANAPVMKYPRAPGLSSVNKQRSLPAVSSDEIIGKRMLTGNLLEDPDELTRMARIYKKHGVLDEMAPWLNEAYGAKKRGIPHALHLLLSGDGKGASQVLRNGGIKLVDDPVRINPDDPLSNSWKLRFEDGRERDINLKAIATKFFPSSILHPKG